ncbi:hypothetical protein OSG_eHP1_00120 [environmental Halophage eHP-1]|nr:hypothetical protein OSG_eHP1_00120 [environmental Halophage eHP-1]
MVSVTLSRDGTSIDIQLVEEAGEQLLSSTFGKPEVNVRESGGSLNPRVQDQWSGVENYQLVGRVFNYQTAHDLADLIKSSKSDPLELAIPLAEYPNTVTVAPGAGQEGALSLSFPAGKKNSVDVDLSLTRVGDVFGSFTQQATTPTASGNGPVQLSVGGTTVDLPTADLSLERAVGRPNDVVRRQPQQSDPRYEVKPKVTNDVFSLSFQTVQNIPSTLNTLTDNIFRSRLGRTGLTLKFNGVLGLGDIQCIPVGSGPFRQVHQSGKGWVINPVLELRRIFDTT